MQHHSALILGDAMTVFPVFQAFWIGFSVVGGVVFYEVGAVSAVGTLAVRRLPRLAAFW